MMKEALISIIREEHSTVEAQIVAEQRRQDPDATRLTELRREESSLRRQLERITEH
jgi:hypothetical protein